MTDKAGVNMDNAWSDLRNAHNSGTHVFGGSFTVSVIKLSLLKFLMTLANLNRVFGGH